MGQTPMRNLITDVPGVLVGHADDARLGSGATVVLFEAPAAGGMATPGGAPALREGALLGPEMTVERIDAFVLSGGSAFGLDAAGGVMAHLASQGRGFAKGDVRVPITPGAALFDLDHGGDKNWGARSPYGDLGYTAVTNAGPDFALGTAGAGYGAWTYDLQGGLGSASATTSRGFVVGALVAANPAGRVTRGSSPHFWAASYERSAEFGGIGAGVLPDDAFTLCLSSDEPINTTLVVVATDAAFNNAQMTRIAIMASAGIALAMRPAFGPADGDVVFAASTARAKEPPTLRDLAEIGTLAAECVARAIARGIYKAMTLPFPGAKPSWRQRYQSS